MTESEIFEKILIDGELSAGPIVAGDYTLGVRDIEGGHQIVIVKGGQTQTLDVLDGLPGAQGPEGPTGQPGQDGSDGQDGVSPTVSVAEITGGHRVTITDATGSHVFDVMDGANGQDGQPGQDGQDGSDGVSPTVDVDEITGGHRVTITDADGEHQFDVLDGETGAQGPQGPAGQDAVVDATLTQAGQAADAKKTGDEITGIKDALSGFDDSKLNANQGAANAGKILSVAANGSIVPQTITAEDVVIDTSLSVSGAAADAKTVGNELESYNATNVLAKYGTFTNETSAGVTYAWSNDKTELTITGTRTTATTRNIFDSTSDIFPFVPGKTYIADVSRTGSGTESFSIVWFVNGTQKPSIYFPLGKTKFTVPSNATGHRTRIYVPAITYNNDKIAVRVLNAPTNADIDGKVTNLEAGNCINILAKYGSFSNQTLSSSGLSLVWNDANTELSINGANSSAAVNNIIYSNESIAPFEHGKTYHFAVSRSKSTCSFSIVWRKDGADYSAPLYFGNDGYFTVPAADTGVNGVGFRIYFSAGGSYSNDKISVCIFDTLTNAELNRVKLNKNQGSANAGKILVVGADGEVSPQIVNPINSAPYVAIGDSNTMGALWTLDEHGERVISYAEEKYRAPFNIAKAINVNNATILTKSSTGFVNGGSDGKPYLTMLQEANLADVKIITVGSGASDDSKELGTSSDAAGVSTICGKIKEFIEYVQLTFPMAQIVIIQPYPVGNTADPFTRSHGSWNLESYSAQVSNICKAYNVAYVEWHDCTMAKNYYKFQSYIQSNPNHPNDQMVYMQFSHYLAAKISAIYKCY